MQYFKFYVIGLLFLMGAQNLNAQSSKPVTLGLTASPNFAWFNISNNGYNSDGSKLGIRYGLTTDFRLFNEDNYALSSGITINHLGSKWVAPSVVNIDGTNYPSKENAEFNYTYIDVPVLIKLKTNEIGYNWFYGVFGSELGFNINAKKSFTHTWSGGTTPSTNQEITNEVNLLRSSLVFGAGIERMISGNAHYFIGVTYHNGLTNVLQGKAYLADGNGDTVMEGNNAKTDRDLSTKLKFLEINLGIVF